MVNVSSNLISGSKAIKLVNSVNSDSEKKQSMDFFGQEIDDSQQAQKTTSPSKSASSKILKNLDKSLNGLIKNPKDKTPPDASTVDSNSEIPRSRFGALLDETVPGQPGGLIQPTTREAVLEKFGLAMPGNPPGAGLMSPSPQGPQGGGPGGIGLFSGGGGASAVASASAVANVNIGSGSGGAIGSGSGGAIGGGSGGAIGGGDSLISNNSNPNQTGDPLERIGQAEIDTGKFI
jgi:hypothetical protein